jgi:hypothetical protein
MEQEVIRLRNEMKSIQQISEVLKCSVSKVYKICLDNGLNRIGLKGGCKGLNMTSESRKKISDSKKKLYRDHPEKHNWKSNKKFISKPCEEFKKILDDASINYVSEFTPLEDRFFSIDIAFPESKIGVEINGNQHYNKDGTLKKYYYERHQLIESAGWKIYEVHFSICYNKDVVLELMENIFVQKTDLYSFDYDDYLKQKISVTEKKYSCVVCGGVKKDKYSKQCTKCQHFSKRKVIERPTYVQLMLDVEELGYTRSGKKYGVSDNTIRKWLKSFKKEKD